MKTCKTCKWWSNGECDLIEQEEAIFWHCQPDHLKSVPKEDSHFHLNVDISDDTGLYVSLCTGPDFGCIKHEER